jgi:hypothetical protein
LEIASPYLILLYVGVILQEQKNLGGAIYKLHRPV